MYLFENKGLRILSSAYNYDAWGVNCAKHKRYLKSRELKRPNGVFSNRISWFRSVAIISVIIMSIGLYGVVIGAIDFSELIKIVADLMKKIGQSIKITLKIAKEIGTELGKTTSKILNIVRSSYKSISKAVVVAITIAVADAKIKSKIKREKRFDYWIAYFTNHIVEIGNHLSRNSAVTRVRRGLDVFYL